MPNYIFTDANGQKQTINEHQLRTLAARGIITPQTVLETDAGQKGLAGQIPGLFAATPSPFQATPPMVNVPQQQGTTAHSQQTVIMQMGPWLLVWLLDFGFRDIRLPAINLWACRAIYVICSIGAILFGLWATVTICGEPDPRDRFAVLVVWPGVILFVIVVRLILEQEIILFDWITETTKAARRYNEQGK